MMFLKENGKCSQSQIHLELKIDSAAITRHLKILEEKIMLLENVTKKIIEKFLFS